MGAENRQGSSRMPLAATGVSSEDLAVARHDLAAPVKGHTTCGAGGDIAAWQEHGRCPCCSR